MSNKVNILTEKGIFTPLNNGQRELITSLTKDKWAIIYGERQSGKTVTLLSYYIWQIINKKISKVAIICNNEEIARHASYIIQQLLNVAKTDCLINPSEILPAFKFATWTDIINVLRGQKYDYMLIQDIHVCPNIEKLVDLLKYAKHNNITVHVECAYDIPVVKTLVNAHIQWLELYIKTMGIEVNKYTLTYDEQNTKEAFA